MSRITQDKQKGLLYLHSASLIFGGTALFSNWIGLPALDITIWRSFIAAFTLFIILLLSRRKIRLESTQHGWLMLTCGLFLGVHWVTYFHSMQIAGVAVGMISLYTYPIMTVFLEPLFHGQRPHVADIICAIVMLTGIALMVPEFNLDNDITLGVCWGILSAALFSLRNIFQKRFLSNHYAGDTSMLYQSLVVGLLVIPWITANPSNVSSNHWWLLVILGTLFTALPHSLFANSLRYLKAKTVGLIGCLQPVYGTLLAAWLLSEQPGFLTLLGGGLILSAALIESYRA